jgi:hypothetical protein
MQTNLLKSEPLSGGLFVGGLERRFERYNRNMISGMWLQPVQKLVATIIFAHGKDANESPQVRAAFGRSFYWWT